MNIGYSLESVHHILFTTISDVLTLVVTMPFDLNMVPDQWDNVKLDLLLWYDLYFFSITPSLKGQCLNSWRVAIEYDEEGLHLLLLLAVCQAHAIRYGLGCLHL